ncbi:uncharacterized protein LOC115633887 isoform X2 [Scaptodrosophila lebanonensis]|uniref:Uncharacterized protein LOC115633887 isoform X2 n=1 Tax=Drosophila lebanonensis TaxID=7225 RepID=A0A6J2UFM5_DROLE|nr:uncharacterized protein LOC115633887 isoform X2 [Scaptodrosophila lebanonensis]
MLRKYNEVKKKGEKYEPYCPKRRYFESLMFLKDEEILEKKSKREDNPPPQTSFTENTTTLVQAENCDELSDPENLPKQAKQNENTKLSPSTSATEFCANIFEEADGEPLISIQSVNSTNHNHASGPTVKEVEIILPTNNSNNSGRRKSMQDPSFTSSFKDKNNSGLQIIDVDVDKRISDHQKYKKTPRKRSSSVSSHASENNEVPTGKFFKADISSIDFERLFSLALKSADNHLDDHFTNFGKIIAHKLRGMEPTQAIYAEKIIADVLYQGQMKMLSTLSIHQFLGVDNATVYVESHSK